MKKILFFFVLLIMMMISCTKEKSSVYINIRAKDSSYVHVDHKPMPKGLIPDEPCAK